MKIADQIAAKKSDLAAFVSEAAAAVISEPMDDAQRGIVAVDLLRLMVASGLTPAIPSIDVTPQRAIPPRPTAPSDSQIAASLDDTDGDEVETARRLGVSIPTIQSARSRLKWSPPARDAHTADGLAPQESESAVVVEPDSTERGTEPVSATSPTAQSVDESKPTFAWDSITRDRLADAVARTPRPSNAELAAEFGTSVKRIEAALTRYDLAKGAAGSTGGALKNLSGYRKRNCMSCDESFLSEGNHNRRCRRCKATDSASMVA